LLSSLSKDLLIKVSKVLICAALAIGCSSSEKASSPSNTNVSEEDQRKIDAYKAEVFIGRNMAGRLLQYYGVTDNTPLIEYVNTVGNYVASYSDFPERRYMFQVIDSPEINAFACPGGYILITTGTLKFVKNEAELAAILGHEIAHVGHRHMFDTIKAMDAKELEDNANAIDKNVKVDKELKARERPDPNESEFGNIVARYLTGGTSGVSIVKAASAGMEVMLHKGLDKKYEYEADREGVKYAVSAGYAPYALPALLSRLGKRKSKAGVKDGFSKTHPSPKNRIRNVAKMLDKMDAKNIAGAYGSERYIEQRNTIKTSEK
jgi:beta-barrel assembly-enhancing protease